MDRKKGIPVISLFCGAGGLDLGFQQAGFRTILALDRNPAAVLTFNSNRHKSVAFAQNLLRCGAQRVLGHIETAGVSPIGVIGGPPCQGFSRGNVASNSRDPRNYLAYSYATLLGDLQKHMDLDFFVFENVAGLLSPKHSKRWARIQQRFQDVGFHLFYKVLDAQRYSTPQSRRRLFLVGIHSRIGLTTFKFPKGSDRVRTVKDAITNLPDPVYFTRGLDQEQIPFHPNHWTTMPKSSRFSNQEFNRWRSFRKITWDAPSPTVAYGNREIHIHPSGHRRLSILEAMLLQGFPLSYRIQGNLSEQVTQVCNAVPPPVARAIAKALRKNLGYDVDVKDPRAEI